MSDNYSDIILIKDVINFDLVKINEMTFFSRCRINLDILKQDSNHPDHETIQENNLITSICSQYEPFMISSLPRICKHAILKAVVDEYRGTIFFNGDRVRLTLSLNVKRNGVLYIDKLEEERDHNG